jgi:DNA-binding beta-propeller fold protein YncE
VLLVVALVFLALVPAAAGTRAGGTPVAFVSAEGDDRLVAVDLTTRRVLARIPVPNGPRKVVEAGGARWILVTSPPAGAVTLVDAFSFKVVKVWRGFGYPVGAAVEGRRAYVTDKERGQLVVISLTTRKVVARLNAGPRPHDVAVGDLALVTHESEHPEFTIVDTNLSRRSDLVTLAAGGPAQHVSEQPDSATAYVTYWNSGGVGAVDWGRGRLLWRRNVGTLIHHVQFDYFHGRRLWATDHAKGRSYLLSARDGRVLRTLAGCPGADHVAFGGTAWLAVACRDADALAVYETRTWQRTLVSVGGGPRGVAVAVVP